VEQKIRELRDTGALSGLPGEGAPLPRDPDADAGDAWAARHLSRTARARPAWAELREDIGQRRRLIGARLRAHLAWKERRAAFLERLPAERILRERAATAEADARIARDVVAAIQELNALVRRHNLLVTVASLQLASVTEEELREAAKRDGA
jgi:hypothetical protein